MGGMPTTPVLDQESFQGRDDTQSLNSATFSESLNTDFNQDVDTTFRLRFEIQETAGGSNTGAISLSCEKNGTGGYAVVTTSSSNVRITTSSQFANGDNTTQVIGDGSFVTGDGVADPGVASANLTLNNQSTEIEFALTIVSGDVSNGDKLAFRCQMTGVDLDSYTQEPAITAVKAAGTRRIFAVS